MPDVHAVDNGPERIVRYLDGAGIPAASRVVPITPDASDRRYFRVFPPGARSIVLALHTGPIERARLPFSDVHELFSQIPLPVPAILGHSDEGGILALDDLGDITLQEHLRSASDPDRVALYREAIGLIERLQRRGAELASDRHVPYRTAFDVEKLTWELDYFTRHFLTGLRGVDLTPAERAALDDEWRAMAGELAAEPRVLCHRDYHSRNLMWHAGGLHVIDFQDARMGPDTYDLASLLRDSYIELTPREIDEHIACFLAMKDAPGARPDAGRAGEFRRRFDLMSLQRNLKALGTFGYQAVARANPVYVQYVPRTLGYVRSNLAKYERFGRLRDLLAAGIEELR